MIVALQDFLRCSTDYAHFLGKAAALLPLLINYFLTGHVCLCWWWGRLATKQPVWQKRRIWTSISGQRHQVHWSIRLTGCWLYSLVCVVTVMLQQQLRASGSQSFFWCSADYTNFPWKHSRFTATADRLPSKQVCEYVLIARLIGHRATCRQKRRILTSVSG